MTGTQGRLLLVPTPLDFGCATLAPIADVLPTATLQAAAHTTHWIAENAKSTRAFLKRVGELYPLALPLQQQTITELPRQVHKKGDHLSGKAPAFDARGLLGAALQGHDVGLVSEAGMPASLTSPTSCPCRAAPSNPRASNAGALPLRWSPFLCTCRGNSVMVCCCRGKARGYSSPTRLRKARVDLAFSAIQCVVCAAACRVAVGSTSAMGASVAQPKSSGVGTSSRRPWVPVTAAAPRRHATSARCG